MNKSRYFIIHKPFGVLSQFTKEQEDHRTLRDAFSSLPTDVYPVGRLDRDSEGLLVISNDKSINQRILHPDSKLTKKYWVQVEGTFSKEAKTQLEQGVQIRINKKDFKTGPAKIKMIDQPSEVGDRNPPVRFRQNIPTTWVSVSITEGKNRQVRKMCAKVGFPVLRLIRYSIGDLKIEGLGMGEVREIQQIELFGKLKLKTLSTRKKEKPNIFRK